MIKFTRHAVLKLKQRGITRNLVIRTLNSPDRIFSTYGCRMAAFKKFRGLYLKVIFVKNDKIITVITQHWVSKINS